MQKSLSVPRFAQGLLPRDFPGRLLPEGCSFSDRNVGYDFFLARNDTSCGAFLPHAGGLTHAGCAGLAKTGSLPRVIGRAALVWQGGYQETHSCANNEFGR
jgi:hypothetical protein